MFTPQNMNCIPDGRYIVQQLLVPHHITDRFQIDPCLRTNHAVISEPSPHRLKSARAVVFLQLLHERRFIKARLPKRPVPAGGTLANGGCFRPKLRVGQRLDHVSSSAFTKDKNIACMYLGEPPAWHFVVRSGRARYQIRYNRHTEVIGEKCVCVP